jgi:hypothetical protein
VAQVSRVAVDELCGGAVELVERCDALLWRARRAVGRRLQRRGTHGLAQSLNMGQQHVPGVSSGKTSGRTSGSTHGGKSGERGGSARTASSGTEAGAGGGRRLAGKKKERKAAGRAAAAGGGAVNATSLIHDLFRLEYDGPGAQLSGCVLSLEPSIASNRRFL